MVGHWITKFLINKVSKIKGATKNCKKDRLKNAPKSVLQKSEITKQNMAFMNGERETKIICKKTRVFL